MNGSKPFYHEIGAIAVVRMDVSMTAPVPEWMLREHAGVMAHQPPETRS